MGPDLTGLHEADCLSDGLTLCERPSATSRGQSDFGVLVTNANGTTTFETLSELGITSINLTTNNTDIVHADGSKITNETTYTTASVTMGTAADVSLAYDTNGYATQQTVTTNSDGSTTIDVKALNADGSLVSETVQTTSANGLDVTLQFDHTVVNSDGSTRR